MRAAPWRNSKVVDILNKEIWRHINLVLKPLETLDSFRNFDFGWRPHPFAAVESTQWWSLGYKSRAFLQLLNESKCQILNKNLLPSLQNINSIKFSLSLADRSPDINTFSFWWTEQWPIVARCVAALTVEMAGLGSHGCYLRLCHGSASPAPEDGLRFTEGFRELQLRDGTWWDSQDILTAGKSWGEERRLFKFWEPRWPRCFKHLEHPPTSSKSSWLKGHQGNLIRIELISLQFTASQFTNSVLSERLVPCQKVNRDGSD